MTLFGSLYRPLRRGEAKSVSEIVEAQAIWLAASVPKLMVQAGRLEIALQGALEGHRVEVHAVPW